MNEEESDRFFAIPEDFVFLNGDKETEEAESEEE